MGSWGERSPQTDGLSHSLPHRYSLGQPTHISTHTKGRSSPSANHHNHQQPRYCTAWFLGERVCLVTIRCTAPSPPTSRGSCFDSWERHRRLECVCVRIHLDRLVCEALPFLREMVRTCKRPLRVNSGPRTAPRLLHKSQSLQK